MKYRVIDMTTKEDITECYYWVIRPDGSLGYMDYEDFIEYPNAICIPEHGMGLYHELLESARSVKERIRNSDTKD